MYFWPYFRFLLRLMSHNSMTSQPLDEETTKSLLIWIDSIDLSRPKKNINRDFADGVLVAEVIAHYFPQRVEVHNYVPSSSRQGKLTNWATLNRKVLSKFGFSVPQEVIENIISAKVNYVEVFLHGLKRVIETEKSRNEIPEQTQIEKGSGSHRAAPDSLSSTIQAGIPLSQLNLHLLDTETKLILAEKEQSLLASHETIKILQMKVHRLEQLLSLKDKRIEELKRKLHQETL